MKKPVFGLVLALSMAAPALATETTTYTYDANGRLISATHTGTVNNNVGVYYTLDPADNRTNIAVTTNGSPPAGWSGSSQGAISPPSCSSGSLYNQISAGQLTVTAAMILGQCSDSTAGVTLTVTSPSVPVTYQVSHTPFPVSFTVSDGHGNTASGTLTFF